MVRLNRNEAIRKLKERRHFSGFDLSGLDLGGLDFSFANLRGANLSGANLSYATMTGANLDETGMKNVRLIGADFGWGAFLQDLFRQEKPVTLRTA